MTALASSRVRIAQAGVDEIEDRYFAHRSRLSEVFGDHLSPSLQRLMLAILGTSTNAMLADACLVVVGASHGTHTRLTRADGPDPAALATALSGYTSIIAVLVDEADVPDGTLLPSDLSDGAAASAFAMPSSGDETSSTLVSVLHDLSVPRKLRHRNARAFVRWRRETMDVASVASEGDRETVSHPLSEVDEGDRTPEPAAQLDSSVVLGSSASMPRPDQMARRRRTICGPPSSLIWSIGSSSTYAPLASRHDPLTVRSLLRLGLGAAASTLLGVGALASVFVIGATVGWLGSQGLRALGGTVYRRLL